MAVRLNNPAYDYAKRLIGEGRIVLDDRDDIKSAVAHLHGMLDALRQAGAHST